MVNKNYDVLYTIIENGLNADVSRNNFLYLLIKLLKNNTLQMPITIVNSNK